MKLSSPIVKWLQIMVFFSLCFYGGIVFHHIFLSGVKLPGIESLLQYIEPQFTNTAVGRVIKLVWALLVYQIWINTIEKKMSVPKLFTPNSSKFKAYMAGLSLGLLIAISSYIIYQLLGLFEITDFHASAVLILIDIIGVFVLSTCTSVLEELVFRGYLLTRLESLLNTHFSVLFQAILFGLVHADQGFAMFWTTSLAGLVMGYLFVNTRNLYSSIGLHTAVHLSNILSSPLIVSIEYHKDFEKLFYLLDAGNLYGFIGQFSFMILLATLIVQYRYSNIPKSTRHI